MSPSFLYRFGAEMGFRQIHRYHHSRHDIPASLYFILFALQHVDVYESAGSTDAITSLNDEKYLIFVS